MGKERIIELPKTVALFPLLTLSLWTVVLADATFKPDCSWWLKSLLPSLLY